MRSRFLSLFGALGLFGLGAAVVHCVGDAPVEDFCPQYCDKIAAECGQGASGVAAKPPAQFKSRDACLTMCRAWPPGSKGDRAGDTQQCRLAAASTIVESTSPEEKALRCFESGPYSRECGGAPSACDSFCREAMVFCTKENGNPFSSEADCVTKCVGKFGSAFDPASFLDTTTNADTLDCRMFHLENAIEGGGSNLTTHCPHLAMPTPVGKCTGNPMPPADGGTDASDAGADAPSDAPPG